MVIPVLALVHVLVAHVHVQAEGANFYATQLMNLKEHLQLPFFSPGIDPPSPGLHHYKVHDGQNHSRVHLRVDIDGSGLLIINSSRVFHMNPTAVGMAFFALEKSDRSIAVRSLSKMFESSRTTLTHDYTIFCETLDNLIWENSCPICDLDLETITPFSSKPSAPYRMDLAITYRCNNACHHCYNARARDFPEIPSADWKHILDTVWNIGVPHVVFTGGEPTLREDLPELIAHAEKNGQITGLNTNGRKLKDKEYLARLVDAGLDHVQITLESHDANIHDRMVFYPGAWSETVEGLQNALSTRLFVMTNTTMLTHNQSTIPQTLSFLSAIGIPTVGLNALIHSGRGKTVGTGLSETQLSPLLTYAREFTTGHGQKLIWYTPTQYCNFDPIQANLGVKGCTAALYNMCIEPNGSVLPCQSYYQPLGNILNSNWDSIWNHELAISIRERKNLPEKCAGCVLIQECGGGCPLLNQD